ncbi:MAG TPA: hypothetical protein VH593_06725, partial [Ktedonobacteraceae bacterium]
MVLAQLAKGRLREKSEALAKALAGRVRSFHRFMIAEHLGHIDYLDGAIERAGAEIEELTRPFVEEGQLEQLDSVPGISERVAQL